MRTGTTSARPRMATDQQHQRELGLGIYRLLKSNGSNVRPVYGPAGPATPVDTRELIGSRPIVAVQAEVYDFTLTVEITSQRHGEQYTAGVDSVDELRYAVNDLRDFRDYFSALLQLFGLSMMPPATASPSEFVMFMASTAPRRSYCLNTPKTKFEDKTAT